MAAAIAFVLREHRFRAGRFRLALQTCDDSTAQGARALRQRQVPGQRQGRGGRSLRRRRDRPDALRLRVSRCSRCSTALRAARSRCSLPPTPPNRSSGATPTDPAGQLAHLHPAGRQGYARIMPTEDYETRGDGAVRQAYSAAPCSIWRTRSRTTGPYERWFRYAAQRARPGRQRRRRSGTRRRTTTGGSLARARVGREDRGALRQPGRQRRASDPGPARRARPARPDPRLQRLHPAHRALHGGRPGGARRLRLRGRPSARPPEPGGAALPARLRRNAAGWPRHLVRRATRPPRPRRCSTRSPARTGRARRSAGC